MTTTPLIDTATLAARAERLRALHRPGDPLLLPNAWDAASARAVVEAGFPVVATTSSGVAASLGWADGQQAPAAEMLAAVARIARAVDVPVTADLEGGYGLAPEALVARMLAAGAVGCNLEDTDHAHKPQLLDPETHASYLAAVKAAARAAGVDVVLNARVDTFVRPVVEPAQRVAETIRRARIYLAAGADCIFPITVKDPEEIRALVAGIPAPLNVMAMANGPSVAELRALGVARVSFGGGLQRAALEAHRQRLQTIRDAAGGVPA